MSKKRKQQFIELFSKTERHIIVHSILAHGKHLGKTTLGIQVMHDHLAAELKHDDDDKLF